MTYVDAALAPRRKTRQIKIRGPAAFEGMRKAGSRAACVDMLTEHVAPGVPTDTIDRLVYDYALGHGALPADADIPRLPRIDLQVTQPRGLPRVSRRQAAQRR
jgi:hypothetical protein